MLAALLGWARRKDYARDKRISSKCGSSMADQTRVVVQKAHCSLCEDQISRAGVERGDLPGGLRLLVLCSWSLSHPWECALDTPVEGRPLDADLPQEAWPAQPRAHTGPCEPPGPTNPSHPVLSPPPPPCFNSLQQISTEAHSGLIGAWPTQRLWASEMTPVREAQPPSPSCSSPPSSLHLLRSDSWHHTEEGRRASSGALPCATFTHMPSVSLAGVPP